jgi:Domain of unknown function (DUF4383)
MATNQPRVQAPRTTTREPRGTERRRMSAIQTIALVVGGTFLAVGILGFVPGVTTNVGRMEFAGHESPSELLDVFHVSVLHNLVHLAFGIVGIAAARTARSARWYLLIGGVVYLLLLVYGLAVDMNDSANFVPVNDADNWLHLGLGVGMILLGLIPTGERPALEARTERR